MKTGMRAIVPVSAGLMLAACGGGTTIQEPPLKPIAGNPDSTASCPVLQSRKWSARLVKTGGKFTLTVDGEVDLPTPGYTPVWKTGISDRANPPGTQLLLSFTRVVDESEMVAQVVTIHPVHYSAEVSYPRYRYILVRCGDAALVRLPEIQVQP